MKKLIFALLMVVPCAAWGATITRYVNTGSTAGGNGTTNATTGDNRAYATLSAFEAAEQTDLATAGNIMRVYCSGSTDDTTQCTFDGWTTSADDYIEIIGDNTTGIWDDDAYTLKTTQYTLTIQNTATIYLRNMQIYNYMTTNQYGSAIIRAGSSGKQALYVIDCLIRGGGDESTHQYEVYGITENSFGSMYIYNSIIYGFSLNDSCKATNRANSDWYIYNTTVYGNSVGIGGGLVTNCISYNNTTDYSGSFHANSTNNLSKDDTAPALNTYYREKTLSFVNTTAGSEDFHLVSTDTDAIDKGYDLSAVFTTDIDGTTRSGTWDIGCDEYVGSGGTPPAAFPQILIFE